MNIIENQADEFSKRFLPPTPGGPPPVDYRGFIARARLALDEYHNPSYKLEFLKRLCRNTKKISDAHSEICPHKNTDRKCPTDEFYQNTSFFLQAEIDHIKEYIPATDFSETEKTSLNEALEKIMSDLNDLKMGHEIIWTDFNEEIQEVKELYFLSKKTWTQLLIGKITSMVASGVISEALSKPLVEEIQKNYKLFIS